MDAHTIVDFIVERGGVTGRVAVFIARLDLQGVLLPVSEHQGGEVVCDFRL